MTTIRLRPDKRVLFLTKDLSLIRRQLRGELDLRMEDVDPADLLDDVNTDVMTPAWVCFRHRPEDLAKDAYAGLLDEAGRVFPTNALLEGGFEVIVSGRRKGTGSSRETAVHAEKWSGIRIAIAESFAPIHARNNVNQGVLMAGYDVLRRLQAGEDVPLAAFLEGHDAITRRILEAGGLFAFGRAVREGRVELPTPDTDPRPMTMAERVLAAHADLEFVQPGDAVVARVDGGYSHEYTTAQVHKFLRAEHGDEYTIANPDRFAVFEDHLIYADGVERMAPFAAEIETLRELQRVFQRHTGVRDYGAKDGRSPGICHQVAREAIIEPGDFIQATDSHTCMGGGSNALAWGVGATEYAALVHDGFAALKVPESIRFELSGRLRPGVTAKDVMLHILLHHAKPQHTLDRVIEFGGEGLAGLSLDERATLANMATECSARSGICEGDDRLVDWIRGHRPELDATALRERIVRPDEGAVYDGGVHRVDLGSIEPMVATPGDPTNGVLVSALEAVPIDIAYVGSCTAGKVDDVAMVAEVMLSALQEGRRVADGVRLIVQFASEAVHEHAKYTDWLAIFYGTGVEVIAPGCGACIGCGPGVSERADQVTVSAINRNFAGRSGPGRLYLASPYTVAASALAGRIAPWSPR